MTPRPCLECGTLQTTGTRCTPCQQTLNRTRERNRPPRDRTKYSGDYKRRAKTIRDNATTCWVCGQGPKPNDPWQADHIDPTNPASELAAAHRSCNIRRTPRGRSNTNANP